MKRLYCILISMTLASSLFAQFTDTAQLNQFIRDTIKDRRPDKITSAQIQKAMLGISNVLSRNNYFNTDLYNNSRRELHHNARGYGIVTDSIPWIEWILADSTITQPG